ncbi:MAG TPA: hypothetical protein VGM51_14980 [Armatimonadota bacterium]
MKLRLLGLTLTAAILAAVSTHAASPTPQRFALTRYFYGYQADTRKPLPAGLPTRGPQGESVFAVRPMVGIGPWFGYGHSMWHRDNLTTMRHAGIDVALPVFRADTAALNGYATAGLDSMTQALVELKRDHEDYPLIGMFFDTASLGSAADPLDVSTAAGKAAFYNGIKRFFRHVPEEFRALVQTPGGPACILSVGSAGGLKGVSPALHDYCNTQFRADFGRSLLWIAEADWKPLIGSLDAYTTFNESHGLNVNRDGAISIASIGPGYNDSGLDGPAPIVRSRNAGTTMIDDWRTLFKGSTDWIIIESWNDFGHGTAVAPTRDYGVRDQDETMAGLLQFRGESGLVTQALRVNAPEIMLPKSVIPIEIVVQNGSLEQWGRGNISFSASWYQDGKLIEEGPKLPVMQKVPVMGLLTVPVAAVTARQDGTPLPDGKYELRIEFFKSSFQPNTPAFTPFAAPAAVIPVTVGTPPAPEARLITCDASPYLMAGAGSTCRIVVRNDGPATWPKGTAISWKLVSENGDTGLGTGVSAPMAAEVTPGGMSEAVSLTISPAKSTADAPVPVSLMFDVVLAGQPLPVLEGPGAPVRRAANILPLLEVAHFPFGSSVPPSWPAGTDLDVRAAVRNIGPTTWKASEFKVGYHWFYWDGTEALWDSQKTAIPNDLKPGEETLVHMNATAPTSAGAYVFTVDVWDGKQWISTLPGTAGFDTSLTYVNIVGGNLRPVDLTGLFDVDGVASEGEPGDGDFADGFTYPGEQFPPDVQPPLKMSSAPQGPYPPGVAPVLYPAGYFGPVDTIGARSTRRIPFRFSPKRDGDRNFILSRGQTLPVGVGAYNRLFILGAATQDSSGTFRLNYADGSSADVPLQFSAWTDGPKHGETVGLACTYRRSVKGDDAGSHAYLYIYELPVDAGKSLKSITFPEGRRFRVCAITADHKTALELPKPVM